jgi:MFS family permease
MFQDPKERAKAVGTWSGVGGLGATIGVVLSGVIVTEINWRWIFLVNLPVALVVVLIVPRMVRESHQGSDRKLDYMGAVLVTASLTLIVDGLLQAADHSWGSSNVLIPLTVGGALLIAFIVSQRVVRVPLVALSFFRNRTRVTANLATVFNGAGFFTMFFVVTLYMQDVLHWSPLKAGLAWLPFGVMLFVGLAVTTQVLPRFGVKRSLTVSFLVAGLGLFLLSGISTNGGYASHLLPGMLVMALGQGINFIGLQNSSLHKLGHSDAGLGAAVQNTSQQLGGSLGLAVLVSIALRHTDSRLSHGAAASVAATDGYVWALRLGAAAMVVGAIVVATLFENVAFIPPDQAALDAAEAATGATSSDSSSAAASDAKSAASSTGPSAVLES